jgi:hypothetical protein
MSIDIRDPDAIFAKNAVQGPGLAGQLEGDAQPYKD